MTALDRDRTPLRNGIVSRLLGLASDPRFQDWAARFPLTRPFVRREGEAIFDLVSGFVQSQALRAIVELDILEACYDPRSAAEIAARTDLTEDRAELLLRAAVSMDLLSLRRDRFRTTTRGAALTTVPGLRGMILHHDVLYRDLSDPVAFLRGETKPELAGFWPYVFGGGAGGAEARRYSRLMSDSQSLVATETLAHVKLKGIRRLLDIGGGTGTFLHHALDRAPGMEGALMDLPPVVEGVPDALRRRITVHSASFRDDPIPEGADAISLVRVLYDHSDDTVAGLLRKVYEALPSGGRLIVSEPMTGGPRPTRPGDVYFAFYCAAMGTGRARSCERIGEMIEAAGFTDLRHHAPRRAFVTCVVEAKRP